MVNCPSCSAPIDEDFGMVTCPQCKAVFMIDFGGNIQYGEDHSEPTGADDLTDPHGAHLTQDSEEDSIDEGEGLSAQSEDSFLTEESSFESQQDNPESSWDEPEEQSWDEPDNESWSSENEDQANDYGADLAGDGEGDFESYGVEPSGVEESFAEASAEDSGDYEEMAPSADDEVETLTGETPGVSEEEFASFEKVPQDLAPAAAGPIDVSEFGNSEESLLEDGEIVYNLTISGIDSKDLRNSLKYVLMDEKLQLNYHEYINKIKNGEVTIPNLHPIKAKRIVEQLQFMDVSLRWKQRSIIIEESEPVDVEDSGEMPHE
ncbi:MAG: hypothetical protein KDD33_02580 [Bdellovibrionales bacterium]|nr:hypothetical protein [Bdellovibrionales bacterium]